jgi:PAS domain-containing protein
MITQDSLELENACESFNPSVAKLRAMIDAISVIAWCSPPDGCGEFWNRRWHDYTGLSVEAARAPLSGMDCESNREVPASHE